MIFPADPRTLPARPPSEVEWEELLVRVEIAPRALRVTVDDAPDDPALATILAQGVRAEATLQALLDAMVEGRESPSAPAEIEGMDGDAASLVARYVGLRTRTFAMVQRRGLNVWDWRVRGGSFDGATTYQLLQAAAQMDAVLLAEVRRVTRGGGAG